MDAAIETYQVLEGLSQLRQVVQTLTQKVEWLITERKRPMLLTDHHYVVCDTKMHRGEPTIRGTAITVRTVVERTRLGDSVQDVAEAYPVLTPARVHDAMGYYYDHIDEIEQYIVENKKAVERNNYKNLAEFAERGEKK